MSSSRIAGARRLPAPVVFAVALLIVWFVLSGLLPSAADAAVKRKYRTQYKAGVSFLLGYKNNMKKSYNVALADVLAAHDELQEILAQDPVDGDALAAEQAYCRDRSDEVMILQSWPRDLKLGSRNFYLKARGWFSTRADKTAFRRAIRQIGTGSDAISEAIDYMSQAYAALGATPILWSVETECRAQMNDLAVKANAQFKKAFATLRSLER